MHFLLNLLRIKGFYMFRGVPQVALGILCANAHNTPSAICTVSPKDEQVMLKTGRGP
jgi:hypothetical protein